MIKTKTYVLIAEDDLDDQYLLSKAAMSQDLKPTLQMCFDGQEVIDYLNKCVQMEMDLPDLILLDLNMPILDGHKTLQYIKRSTQFKHIPVVVFTTSYSEDDIKIAYRNGANSFISKPHSQTELNDVLNVLFTYWLDTVKLPDFNQ
ncbi:response regulator [Marinicellulosiphila megalodicopiae]|uniref:response regulator n=1 Tax=Marinicellulosiphila megalodicopiae TaxID=2724896 RepID=UPI003BB1AFC4